MLKATKLMIFHHRFAIVKKLSALILNHNKLAYVPPEVGILKHLEILRLQNNPMKMIPAEVFQKGLEEVLKFLKTYLPESSGIPPSQYSAEMKSLLQSGYAADMKFNVDGMIFPAHKMIIDARCPMLLLYDRNADKEVIVASIKKDVFETLLNFVYTEDFMIDFESQRKSFCSELLSLASYLKLAELESICEKFNLLKQNKLVQIPFEKTKIN